MPIEIVISLISSVIGGLLVAIVNQLFAKKKNEAEIEKLKAEAEKIKAEAEKVRTEIKRLNSTVEKANYYASTKDEIVLFDGTKGFYEQDYSGAG
jgi:cell division protein FtsB